MVIADDSTVAREGLAAIIRHDLGYTVSGLATDERTMHELTEKHHPDLLVVEPFLGHHDGIFLLKQLAARFRRGRILAVSRQPEEIYAERALRAGASGYWMKTSTREELIRAIVLSSQVSFTLARGSLCALFTRLLTARQHILRYRT